MRGGGPQWHLHTAIHYYNSIFIYFPKLSAKIGTSHKNTISEWQSSACAHIFFFSPSYQFDCFENTIRHRQFICKIIHRTDCGRIEFLFAVRRQLSSVLFEPIWSSIYLKSNGSWNNSRLYTYCAYLLNSFVYTVDEAHEKQTENATMTAIKIYNTSDKNSTRSTFYSASVWMITIIITIICMHAMLQFRTTDRPIEFWFGCIDNWCMVCGGIRRAVCHCVVHSANAHSIRTVYVCICIWCSVWRIFVSLCFAEWKFRTNLNVNSALRYFSGAQFYLFFFSLSKYNGLERRVNKNNKTRTKKGEKKNLLNATAKLKRQRTLFSTFDSSRTSTTPTVAWCSEYRHIYIYIDVCGAHRQPATAMDDFVCVCVFVRDTSCHTTIAVRVSAIQRRHRCVRVCASNTSAVCHLNIKYFFFPSVLLFSRRNWCALCFIFSHTIDVWLAVFFLFSQNKW